MAFTICNTGSAGAGTSVAGIYIDGSWQQDQAVGALGAGICTDPVTIGPFTISGESDTIEVRADKNSAVTESDEQNNSAQSSMPPPAGGETKAQSIREPENGIHPQKTHKLDNLF